MMAHKDWVRWVFASAADYFKRVAEEQGLPVLVEGLDERTEAFCGLRTVPKCVSLGRSLRR